MMNSNLLLIGFMGVGKSSLARQLSQELGVVNIDTDKIIENFDGRKVKVIFKESGEIYFRELEKKVAFWLQSSVNKTIISTGGGFFAVNNLKNIGKVIYLRSTYKGIMKRILDDPNSKKKLAKRPLLQDKKKAKELFAKREILYTEKADLIIDVESKDVSKIICEIKEFWNKNI